MLFLQNKQVQTALSEYFTNRIAQNLQVDISFSKLNYTFFKRLQVYDFYMSDQQGDTLLYAEVAKGSIRKFRPDKLNVQIKKITFENAYIQIIMDDQLNSSIQFLIDSLKLDIPPEDKVVLRIDQMDFHDSRFRRIDSLYIPEETGIDFSDMDIRNVNLRIDDFLFLRDTTYMKFRNVSGTEVSGFELTSVDFNFVTNPKFMTFSEGSVHTPFSDALVPVIDFRFSDPVNFKYFYDSVYTYISTSESMLDFKDIAYFFPQVKDLMGVIELNGAVFGPFGDLKGENIFVDYLNDTKLEFDMRLTGMPSEDSLFMDFNFRNFTTNRKEIQELSSAYQIGFLNDTSKFNILTDIFFKGSFKGYQTDFKTNGILNTNLGNIILELNMKPDTSRQILFNGNLESDDFLLGKLIGNEKNFGNIDFDIHIDGKNNNNDLSANISGTIDTVGFYNYNYSNILLEGNFSNRKFDGSLFINDPNIDLIFAGAIDLDDEIPVYDFTLDVSNLRPYYLHLRNDDPEYFASFFLKTNMTGKNLNDLNGRIQLINSLFRRTGSQIQMYDLELLTENNPESSFISFKSDLLDAEIKGSYDLQKLPSVFAGIINNHFDILPGSLPGIDTTNTFSLDVKLKNVNPIFDFFFPSFSIADNTFLEGNFETNAGNYFFSCNGSLPNLSFRDLNYSNVNFSLQSDTGGLKSIIRGDLLSSKGGFALEYPEIRANFAKNKNLIAIEWDNDSVPKYAGNIQIKGEISRQINGSPTYSMELVPSYIYYDNKQFMMPHSFAKLSNEGFSIDSFYISGNNQYILTDGTYSNHPHDSITLAFGNLNMHMINDIQKQLLLNIEGAISGRLTLRKESGKPVFTSHLLADNIFINDEELGDISMNLNWVSDLQRLNLGVKSIGNFNNRIFASGYYKPKSEYMNFEFKLSDFEIATLQSYLKENFEDIGGLANIEFNLEGQVKKPEINGKVIFNNASLQLIQTKNLYTFNDELRIYKNDIFFDEFEIFDKYNSKLTARGNVTTSDFKNIFLNLDLEAQNFNFLSTTRFDNEEFYGDIFASATAQIRGPIHELAIQAYAVSEKNTNLKLPLYNPIEIQSTDYIRFINPNQNNFKDIPVKVEKDFGFTLDMDLDIASNTNVQLIFDPKVGDIIEASANGKLKVEIDEDGDFSVFGDVSIQDGEYLFTLQNVINKRFRVKQGGTIAWNGSPNSATVNLEAIYETKASTYSLSPDPTESMKKRIPVHCLLLLQGDLTNPTITPRIVLPTAEPETRSLVETSIGTDEELMRQFISLLIINNFISSAEFSSSPIGGGTGVAGVTASELLSNQLSNWLSQISNDFDIGINYRPGDAVSSDEVEVALSTQLLNDRIIFSGNLDVLGDEVATSGGGASNIVGDFDLEFMLSDKISLKAFNRVNDDRIIRPSLYTQGLGVLYRSEFNKVSEIFRKKKDKKEEKKSLEDEENNAALKEESPEIINEQH